MLAIKVCILCVCVCARAPYSVSAAGYISLLCMRIIMYSSIVLYNRRSCWVCFATEEDDRTAAWVRPCRCRGTTKWVHQTCLQRWVDEKQKGNSTVKVACPQCNTEYLILFPKLGKTFFICY